MVDGQAPPGRTSRLLARVALLAIGLTALVSVALVAQRLGDRPASSTAPVARCTAPPTPPATYPTFSTAPPAGVAEAAAWDVTVRTTCGTLTLVLDGRAAPRSVASFVTLARAGYWTDSVCHRLTSRQAPTAFLQCGDPSGRSTAEPGYDLPLENVPADRTYRVGDVGLSRGDGFPGTAGEFFVVHRTFTAPADGPVYSVVGRVVSGQDVVQYVAGRGGEDTRPDGPPFQSISVLSVDVRRR